MTERNRDFAQVKVGTVVGFDKAATKGVKNNAPYNVHRVRGFLYFYDDNHDCRVVGSHERWMDWRGYIISHPAAAGRCVMADAMKGVVTDPDPNHPMTRALSELVASLNLDGAVLFSFADGMAHINSCSPDHTFGTVMENVADMMLADFASGRYDAALPQPQRGEG